MLSVGQQYHACVSLPCSHGESSHDVGPLVQRHVQGLAWDALGVDDDGGEHLALCHSHGGSREGVGGWIDDEQAFEGDAVGGNAWGVKGSGRVEPGAPCGLVASWESFALCA